LAVIEFTIKKLKSSPQTLFAKPKAKEKSEMCDHTFAVHCFVDNVVNYHVAIIEDLRFEVTDAEVLAIARVAVLYFGGTFERSCLVLYVSLSLFNGAI
jgi:hypothetical protein